MSYTQITARVNDQALLLVNIPLLASGSIGVLQFRCEFDALWDNYGKVGVFYRSEDKVYHVPLVNGIVTAPAEVLKGSGCFYFGIMGTAENTRTTEVLKITLVKGAITAATATPADPTPNIYRQLLAAYGVIDSRMDALVAMRSTGGGGSYNLSDEYISGTIKTNGASALIDFTISALSLVAGGHHYTDYCIQPELAPLGPVYLETSNPDINVTMEPASSDGWARLLIENVGTAMYTTDMVTTASAYYPLASVSISELGDVRVDVDGETHATAGEAVRSQVRELREQTAPAIIDTLTGSIFRETRLAAKGRNMVNWRAFGNPGNSFLESPNLVPVPAPTAPVSIEAPQSARLFYWNPIVSNDGSFDDSQDVEMIFQHQMAGLVVHDANSICTKHNYTDEYGRKWLADEVDVARGVYIQRCFILSFDGNEDWFLTSAGIPTIGRTEIEALKDFDTGTSAADNGYCAYMLCSHFPAMPRQGSKPAAYVSSYAGDHGNSLMFVWPDYTGDLEGWKAWLAQQAAAGTPVTMVLGRKTPVETPLVGAELPIMNPNFMASATGLNQEIRYIADTKAYIDQKMAAISAAMLNN